MSVDNKKLNQERRYWKQTRQTRDGVECYIDPTYWTGRNPNYRAGRSTKTSFEMMEWFLRGVGKKSSLSFDRNKERTPDSTQYLFYCWAQLLDQTGNFNSKKFNPEPLKWFAELEHLITNNEMFWTLVRDVWVLGSHFLKEDVFARYGRDQMTFEDRQKCLDYLDEYTIDGIIKRKNPTKKGLDFQLYRYNSFSENEFITIYRSFKVEKGKSVRSESTRNSKEHHKQCEGKSYSYSFNKTNAIFLNDKINTCQLQEYCNVNKIKAKNIALMNGYLNEWEIQNPIYNEGFYTCIAEYKVKKEDIIFCTDHLGEDEVVVDPSNAMLVDYRFLNILDFMTSRTVRAVIALLNNSDNKINRSSILNIDGLYDFTHAITGKYLRRNADEIKSILLHDSAIKEDAYHLTEISSFEFLKYESSKVHLTVIRGLSDNGNVVCDFSKTSDGIRQRVNLQ